MWQHVFPSQVLTQSANKAFKSDSQRLAFTLRSSITKRRSHLNAALCDMPKSRYCSYKFPIKLYLSFIWLG
ncbi:hypothetical protein FP735_23375 [Vibrio parahaemolyticus]|nr:hypothetical protein [Vibrio parahaemolyticus]